MSGEPDRTSRETSKRCAWAIAALTVGVLILRLSTLDFALPFTADPDPHIVAQLETLEDPANDPTKAFAGSIYPLLITRIAMLLPSRAASAEETAAMSLDEHLHAAGRLFREVRTIVALLSILIVPATWWIAKRFVGPVWALFAAALMATSLLDQEFARTVRPHAVAAASITVAIAAALELQKRGDTRSFVAAGVAAALAIGSLHNALAILPALLAAFLLRVDARRRWLDWRALILIGLLALAVLAFYPFVFMNRPPGPRAPDAGTIDIGGHWILLSDFNGRGIEVVGPTLWFFEPAMLLLATLGAVWWSVSRIRGERNRERRADFVVVLAFFVPYLTALLLFERCQQRFVLPLLPEFACAAAFGLREVWCAATRDRSRTVARAAGAALMLAALAVPTAAVVGNTTMRTRPHTLELLADWIRAHVDPANERVALTIGTDVPLPRRTEDLFDAHGSPLDKSGASPWERYQQGSMSKVWKGERWNIETLFADAPVAELAKIARSPSDYLRSIDADYVVVPGERFSDSLPFTKAVREVLERDAVLVERLPHETRPTWYPRDGLHVYNMTWFTLTNRWIGPELEIYRWKREPKPAK